MKRIIVMVGFESNNIMAFYRRSLRYPVSKDVDYDWTTMQAFPVRKYWYEILYKRLPEIIKTLNYRVTIYEDL
jgi:hypothetical protein